MVSETHKIESYDIPQEKRFEIIKEWIGKIKPVKSAPAWIGIVILPAYWIFGLIGGFVIAGSIIVYYYGIKKPESPKIVTEEKPYLLTIELGIVKDNRPTIIEIKNNTNDVELEYSIFGAQLGSKKFKKRWAFLSEQLEDMIKKSDTS